MCTSHYGRINQIKCYTENKSRYIETTRVKLKQHLMKRRKKENDSIRKHFFLKMYFHLEPHETQCIMLSACRYLSEVESFASSFGTLNSGVKGMVLWSPRNEVYHCITFLTLPKTVVCTFSEEQTQNLHEINFQL